MIWKRLLIFKRLSRKGFYIRGYRDVDLWPNDSKNNRGLLHLMTNLPNQLVNLGQTVLEIYCADMVFTLEVPATLTFDLMTPKTIGVCYTSWPTSLPSLVNLGRTVLEILSGNGFYIGGRRDLDLWPSDPKINKDLLHLITNLATKFGEPRSNRSWDIEWKWFLHLGSTWPWPLT